MKRRVFFIVMISIALIISELLLRLLFLTPQVIARLPVDTVFSAKVYYALSMHFNGALPRKQYERPDSLTGWAPTEGFICNYEQGKLTIDSTGLRITTPANVSDSINIIVVGDSFTFGEEVSDEKTYPYLLDSLLPNARVYNLGVTGYGIDQMYWRLNKYIYTIKPHVVIISPIADDVWRSVTTHSFYFKPCYTKNENGWKLVDNMLPDPESLSTYLWPSYVALILTLLIDRIVPVEGEIKTADVPAAELITFLYQSLNASILKAGALPMFTVLPTPGIYRHAKELKVHNLWECFTADFCRKNNIAFANMKLCFEQNNGKQSIDYNRLHFQQQQNAVIATCLKDALFANKLIP